MSLANPAAGALEQRLVNSHFHSSASYWTEVYRNETVEAAIYRQRHEVVLSIVAELGLPQGSRILELGCGAGLTSVALAQRGYQVEAVDSVPIMVDLTSRHAKQAGVDDRVVSSVGDAHRLEFADEQFALVLAIGLTPWLHSLETALREMARVVRTGGHVIVTADNRHRLAYWLDPRQNPLHAPFRPYVAAILRKAQLLRDSPKPRVRMYAVREFDGYIQAVGLQKQCGVVLGFGPFTLFSRRLLPNSLGVRLHQALQQRAAGIPLLRWAGSQYVVLARKQF
jgi:ubiquinone/menaquinone biosynthesis C-methylase UbiE